MSVQASYRFPWLRELAVPALMLGGIALYAFASMHLSTVALILPLALIVVTVAALLCALVPMLARTKKAERRAVAEDDDEANGPVLNLKAWLLVLLPVPLVAAMEYLGALAALVAMVFGAQLAFGAKSPWKSLLIAIVVAVPTYALFARFLYVRFPHGVLGLG